MGGTCSSPISRPDRLKGEPTYGYLRDYYQGLFMAPHIVGQALKGVIFASALLEELGFHTTPRNGMNKEPILFSKFI